MKRLFIIFSFFLLTTNVIAQSQYIEYHKVLEDEGGVSIKTKPVLIKEKGQQDLGMSLMYETSMKENSEMSGYSLFITFLSLRDDWVIPMDGKLLLRTSSGKVLSLQQSVPKSITLFDSETGYENNTYSKSSFDHYDGYKNSNVYVKFGKYPICEDDLKLIIGEGIIKIRLETTGEIIECVYPVEEEVRVNGQKVSANIVCSSLLPYYKALTENIDLYMTF